MKKCRRKRPEDLLKRGQKVGQRTIELVALVRENAHLERLEIMGLIWQKYPDYSEDQFRMLIYTHKLTVKKSPRRTGPAPLPPGRVKPKASFSLSSVVGYSGRSRLLPGYYEL